MDDRRRVHLELTPRGREVMARVTPPEILVKGLGGLSEPQGRASAEVLRHLLGAIQQAHGLKTFAPCHSCRFNQQDADGYHCGLTQEPLSEPETRLLCREHQYPANQENP